MYREPGGHTSVPHRAVLGNTPPLPSHFGRELIATFSVRAVLGLGQGVPGVRQDWT